MMLDNFKIIEKHDASRMLELIESFPEQCREAKRIGDSFDLPKAFRQSYKNIVCVGMGGSAIGADLVRSYIADDAKVPLSVNRNYTLPNFADEDTLVIASSYSGNTEEVLSAYRDARARGCDIIVITSGGKLEKIAKEDSSPCIKIPSGLPPRSALGYSFFPLLILLSKIGIIKDQSLLIDDAIKVIKKIRDGRLGYKVRFKDNQAKKIAFSLYGKLPVIYASSDHIDSVATRWRGQLAENSKTLASSNLFPEMNHNEIVGWVNPKTVIKNGIVIMLRDAADHPRISKRMDITKNIFKQEKIKVIEVSFLGKELLARIFSLIYIGDFVSFYLAILNGSDPTPVERIVYLKKELGK
jgi:glucose/mannose-6-phosphate isomerase